MIVWINGAFGAGKTTLSEELERRVPDAMMFDPEYVGSILRRWVPPAESGDFQDIPAWRTLTAEFALTLRADYRRPLIVPMTVVNPAYREEIFGRIGKAGERIVHVFLEVPAEELRRRIDAQVLMEDNPELDASFRAFRHSNVERCVAARADLPADTLVLRSDQHTPEELADRVLEAMSG
jgi:adenylylsulfate kinase-like enzyme